MELVPLARLESYESGARVQNATNAEDYEEEQHDFVGNEILSDRIPYSTIYDGKTEIRQRGYFIPAFPVTASIVKVEKRQGFQARLSNPFLYTIELEHGPYKWTIKRRYGDFQRLNNNLKIFRATALLTAPFQRELEPTVLIYNGVSHLVELPDEGQLLERRQSDPVLKSAKESNGKAENTPLIRQAPPIPQRKLSVPVITREAQPKPVISKETMLKAKRRQATEHTLPDFPTIPDIFISDEKLEKRRTRLEGYLSAVLKVKAYRDNTETVRFLEVSRLSFVHNLGSKNKEGVIEIRPNKCEWLGPETQKCCLAYCVNWRDMWLTVKDSFVALIDHRAEIICDVMLFDKDFEVYTQLEYPGDRREAVRKGLFVTNGKRFLMLKCDSVEEAIDWKNQIEDVTLTDGSIWSDDHRFESSFPVRDSVFAQWHVDGRSYMEQAANMIELAREEVFIADFTLNAKIYMKRPIIGDRWRLDMLLKRKADEGVRIFVLLYREVPRLLPGIGSYETESYLTSLSPNIQVLRHPPMSLVDYARLFWAHHEKLIIIDQKIAFVSGIDLCYGRWDDHHHRLVDLGTKKPDSLSPEKIELEQNDGVIQLRELYAQQSSPPASPSIKKKRALITELPKKEEHPTVAEIMDIKCNRLEASRRSRLAPGASEFDKAGRLWPGKDYQNSLLKDLVEPEKELEGNRAVVPIPMIVATDIHATMNTFRLYIINKYRATNDK